MPLEIENNLVAGVRYDGATSTILSQIGIVGVVKTAPGLYVVEILPGGLGDAEDTTACSVEPPNPAVPVNAVVNHKKIDATHHQLQVTSLFSGGLADAPVSFKVYRAATG